MTGDAATVRETALVVLVPEAEPLVGTWRALHDPSSAVGVPAHITLLYPFRAPARLDPPLHAELAALFGSVTSFGYSLSRAARFPGVLYLAPEPAAPFAAITRALARRFPDTPPYGGAFAEVVPHLTVAQCDDDATLDVVARAMADCPPIKARAAAATLLVEGDDGRWRVLDVYPFENDATPRG